MKTEDLVLGGIQIIATCIQGCATIGILLTFIVYFFQLRTMRQQLKASEGAATGQNLLDLIRFLQEESLQDARRVVKRTLKSKSFSQWTEQDEQAAALVCSTYDVVGIIIQQGLIPAAPIVDNWGSSIEDCYKILNPYIREMQKRNGPSFWDDFGWLYEKVAEKDESANKGYEK